MILSNKALNDLRQYLVLFYFSTLFYLAFSRTIPSKCPIKLTTDIPENEPVYLIKNHRQYEFFKPDGEISYIAKNKTLILYCPGRRNHFIARNSKSLLTLKCGSSSIFEDPETNDHNKVELKDFACVKKSKAELKITRDRCATNQGFLYEIGFQLEHSSDNDFLPVFKICYNNETENTFYSLNEINGKAIKYNIKENKRREFKSNGMKSVSSEAVKRIYNRQNQENRFKNLFGYQQKYINTTSFLARGHLSPDADFVFASAQLSTYFYVNVAPQFQSINVGNWKRVENLAKSLAANYQNDFEIYTGFHGVLSLLNNASQMVPIYLDDAQEIEVPLYFWKVIKNLENNSAIAMITLNNPFIRRYSEYQFCPNVCERASLNSKHFNNIRKGYTFCCEIKEFKKTIIDLPESFFSRSLLSCASIDVDGIL